MIEAGTPGGGGVMTAASLALFYQGLLHNPDGLWKPDVLADATTHIRNSFLEPTYQLPANRTIACLVIGNGFASQWVKLPHAYGHPGRRRPVRLRRSRDRPVGRVRATLEAG